MPETLPSGDPKNGFGPLRHGLDEAPIDLDGVEFEVAQMVEAGIASAEVHKPNLDTGPSKRVENAFHTGEIRNERAFGDLQFQS